MYDMKFILFYFIFWINIEYLDDKTKQNWQP